MPVGHSERFTYNAASDIASPRWKRGGIPFLSGTTARKGIVTLADQGIASGTNFLTSVIIGRACSKEEFGLYMLGFSIALLAMSLQTAVISSPYTVYSPRLKGIAHARYTGSTLIHQLAHSALAIICLLIASVVLSRGIGPRGLAPVVLALAVVIPFILLRDYVRRICFAGLRMKTALLLDFCVAAVQLGGLLLLSQLGLLSASRAYWIVGFACGLAALSWLIWSRRLFVFRLSKWLSDITRHWSFAKWLFATNLAHSASILIYPWLLAHFHGTAATGELSACMGVLFLANPLLLGIVNFLVPKASHAFAEGGVEEVRRIVSRGTLFITVSMGFFCVIMVIFGGWIVSLFYGAKYAGKGLLVGILAFGQLASVLTFPINSGLLAMERPDVGCKSYLLALFVTFTFGLWLVNSFGSIGAACGLLMGNVVASAFRYRYFKNLLRTETTKENRL